MEKSNHLRPIYVTSKHTFKRLALLVMGCKWNPYLVADESEPCQEKIG